MGLQSTCTHIKAFTQQATDKTCECKFIGYIFFHSDKRLIESKDVVFIEDTKLITPLKQIKKLLHAEYEESNSHESNSYT